MKGLGKPVRTWGLGNRFCSVVGALLLASFDCFFPLEYGHSWDHSFMEERDKKVPGTTPKLLGLIHPRLVDIFQLKSLAQSEQAMLSRCQIANRRTLTQRDASLGCLGRGKQRAQLASVIFRFPLRKLIAEA